MTCPSEFTLLAFVRGSLADEEHTRTESHLDVCPACLAIVAALARTEPFSPDAPPSPPPSPLLPDGSPRYTPGAEIARGGMGRILKADDRLLRRPVALKLLRRSAEGLERRFVREQRITARLQHPAIVPVYDAGVLPTGEAFFVMRLVKGESLDRSAAKARSFEERLRLLPAVIGVVDAVAYAHGEGVVHRDLKPQNVLVGPFGEVVVVDWGLARERDESADRARASDEASALEPMTTRDGEVLGTLAYMAPEQVRGQAADARSDVYGLGAILYHVLTGAPPHAGRGDSLSTRAAEHAPERLARNAPDAPPDLAAIVQRAMAPEPEVRYPSAQDLAEDLKRWQAGRLVAAHRYTTSDLVRRFVRRYQAAFLVASAALVVLLVLGAVGLRRIFAERAFARAEQARAESARARAESERAAAEALVSFILGDLRDRLERVGRLDALDGVARAVKDYQDRSVGAEDAGALLRRAEVAGLAGDVAFARGDLAGAEESYQRSRTAADSAGAGDLAAAARCLAAVRLGDVHKRRGELDEATTLYESCAAMGREGAGPELRGLFVRTHVALAEVARLRGDLLASRRLLELARPAALSLVAEAGGPASEASRLLFSLRCDRWKTLNLSGEVRAEREEAVAALDLARARVAARPDDMVARYDLASAEMQLGAADEHAGELAAAEPSYRAAHAGYRALAERDPSNIEWQRAVGAMSDRLGALAIARGDAEAALPWMRESDASSARLVALAPDNLEWQRDQSVSALALGDVLRALRRVDEARVEMRRAVDLLEKLAEKAPDARRSEHDLGVALGHLGQLELETKRLDVGQAAQRRSVELLKRHLAAVDTPQNRHEVAAALLILAENERGPSAAAHVDEALAILRPIEATAEENADLRDLIQDARKLERKVKGRR
ncbi:protein kinase domain-containing protein [Polyangium sorediatum]|uniref:Serine/threonine-protein kinase n=1 Tax=Polyangium sorediatum TaxID=889274 RepID=A0ABT6P3Y8_9BACT|nr:serine/threonine-protein kinase [Polyangium sorediatum]MDI1435329.1 serine/threonine-protein kinase [Polyangium sorediatum]